MDKINKSYESGVTLISLIVTVIVLLIIAGASISSIKGDDSVIVQAQNAVNKTNESQLLEELQMQIAKYQMTYYEKENRNITMAELYDEFYKSDKYKIIYCEIENVAMLDDGLIYIEDSNEKNKIKSIILIHVSDDSVEFKVSNNGYNIEIVN